MPQTDFTWMTLAELASGIRAGDFSPLEITRAALDRIDKLDPKLGAFRLVCPERALDQAKAAEIDLAAGKDLGPLHGLPYGVKDLFDVKGLITTAGTSLLADNTAEDDSMAVANLNRAGMVLVGKTNTVQFAYGGVGINHDHGTPMNPWSEEPHAPGGSSSGSASAVSAGLVPLALGSDTGGSVRIPSGLCGITGLKTTVGQVGRSGVYPLSWTLDSIGPLVRTAEDAALVYQALKGYDPDDETTFHQQPQDVLKNLHAGVKGLRLAVAETFLWDDADPEVCQAVREAAKVFIDLGAMVDNIDFAPAQAVLDHNTQGFVIAGEAYTVNRNWVENNYDQLDPVVAARLKLGRDVAAHTYLEAYLKMKQLRSEAVEAMADIDALLVPTTMIPSLPNATIDPDMDTYVGYNVRYLRNTSIGNSLNLCGLSTPCGFNKAGLPLGLLIYGKPNCEDMVLRIGQAFQQATDWHEQHPDLSWAE